MGFVRALARIFLIGTNVLELVGGIAILVAASLALSHAQGVGGSEGDTMRIGSIVMIVTGGIIALQALVGCCGAWKQNRVLLILYAIWVAILLIVALVLTIFAFMEMLSPQDPKAYRESLLQYDENDTITPSTVYWDLTQQTSKCCGIHDFSDWWAHPQFDANGQRFPRSCCKEPTSTGCDPSNPTPGSFYTEGCQDAIQKAQQMMPALAYTYLAVSILLAISFACALILLCTKRE